MTSSIALVTCNNCPEEDPDEALLSEALSRAGLTPSLVAWDDPSVDWRSFGLCVLRSTWNYYHSLAAFRAWVDRVAQASVLYNPRSFVQWNLHKRYLEALESQGLPVVTTRWIDRVDPAGQLARASQAFGFPFVLKPAVSAGSYGAMVVHRPEELARATAHTLEQLGRDGIELMMAQPYFSSVETWGERSVIWIDGEVRHSIRKAPRFGGQKEQVSEGAVALPDAERSAAERVLRVVQEGPMPGLEHEKHQALLYARVDLVRDEHGVPHVMELELVEPSLFLKQHPPSLEALVRALVSRMPSGQHGAR